MKKFIEKLIKKLKQLPHAQEDMWVWVVDAEVTIRELAEEYENDFCEWEDTESLREKGIFFSSDGLYKPSCNDDEDDFRDWDWIRHFRYCPYCGKKIKVVE